MNAGDDGATGPSGAGSQPRLPASRSRRSPSSRARGHAGQQTALVARPLLSRRQAWAGLAISVAIALAWHWLSPRDGGLLRLVAELRFSGVGPGALLLALPMLLGAVLPTGLVGLFSVASQGWASNDGQPSRAHGALRRRAAVLAGWCVALVFAWCWAGLERKPAGWHGAGIVESMLPCLGAALGAFLGGALHHPAGAALRGLCLRLLAALALAGGGMLLLLAAVISAAPADLPASRITSEEKRQLFALARAHSPLHVPPGSTTELRLSPRQLESVLAWALTVFDPQARSRVDSLGNGLSAAATVGRGGWYVNASIELGGYTRFPSGLVVERCVLKLGRLGLRDGMCRGLVRGLYSALAHHPSLRTVFGSIRLLEITEHGARARYDIVTVDAEAKDAARQLLGPPRSVRDGVEAQALMLRDRHRELLAAPDPFVATLRASFALARERAGASDARLENQAALLALGGLFGHPHVFTLAGLAAPEDHAELYQTYAALALRRRADWRRHFLVSAALTQLSSALVSDAAGLLKEELDAGNGSGFSFSDLQMDRAGTRFGELAVRDAATAARLQEAIVDGDALFDYVPPADDMPDGIPDAEFQAIYGGVGGAGYRRLAAEIERRLDAAHRGAVGPGADAAARETFGR